MAHSFGGRLAQGQEIDSVTKGNIVFTGQSKTLVGGVSTTRTPATSARTASRAGQEWWDISQSHFFTVQIEGLVNRNGNPFRFSSGAYSNYVPIKSMNLSYTSYENMNIPFGIFGDLPILHKKRVSTISISCYDVDKDSIEMALRAWENRCFPESRYVAYLDDVKSVFTYKSYDTKGKNTMQKDFLVIPASSVSVSRGYEENSPKLLNFSLAVVGVPGASVRGLRILEHGYGEGYETADLYYELGVSAITQPSGRDNEALNYFSR